jgi:hypothetical protein
LSKGGKLFFRKLLSLIPTTGENTLDVKIRFSRNFNFTAANRELEQFFKKTRPVFVVEFNHGLPPIYGKILEEEGDGEFVEIILYSDFGIFGPAGNIRGDFKDQEIRIVFKENPPKKTSNPRRE